MNNAQQLAIKFLHRAERTSLELRNFLASKGVAESEIVTVLEWAIAKTYVDDSRVAEREIEIAKSKSIGPEKLRMKLEKRGLVEYFDKVELGDDLANAKQLIKKKKITDKSKAARVLNSQGYSEEIIHEVIESWEIDFES